MHERVWYTSRGAGAIKAGAARVKAAAGFDDDSSTSVTACGQEQSRLNFHTLFLPLPSRVLSVLAHQINIVVF